MLELSDKLDESSERKRLISGLAYHLRALVTGHECDGVIPDSMQQVQLSKEIIKEIRAPSNKKLANCLSAIDDLLNTIHSPDDMKDEFYRKILYFLKELNPET